MLQRVAVGPSLLCMGNSSTQDTVRIEARELKAGDIVVRGGIVRRVDFVSAGVGACVKAREVETGARANFIVGDATSLVRVIR